MKDILKKHKSKRGFTLAEVLITLVIIGVVTALTIPSLLANINDKTYQTKRQGFATRMAQAISQIGMLNAYESDDTDIAKKEENSSMNFIVEGLQKAYSIVQVCEIENFKACDFVDIMKRIDGNQFTTSSYKKWNNLTALNEEQTATALGGLNTKGAVLRTKNGESILLYYNPKCIAEQVLEYDTVLETGMAPGTKYFGKEICVNMIYDLDGGKKGPNTIGRDIGFAIILYPDTPYLVMTNGLFYGGTGKYSYTTAETDTADYYCKNTLTAYGYQIGQWTLASREEIYAASVNYNLLVNAQGNAMSWSSTVEGAESTDYGWQVNEFTLIGKLTTRNTSGSFTCTLDSSK